MRKYSYLPLILVLYLPLWYTAKVLHGSFSYLINIIFHQGLYNVLKEIFVFSYSSIGIGILFFLFIKYIAPKVSLLLTSTILLTAYYLFLSPSFFYDNLGIFFIISALSFNKTKQSEYLFFSLFFITLLHTFSSLLICIHYYGHNIPLLLALITPISAFYLLMSKDIYPSKITLISLFPILLFPISYYTHNSLPLTTACLISTVLSITSTYVILERKSSTSHLLLIILSCSSLFIMGEMMLLPFIFTPIMLLIGTIQQFYASKHKKPSHKTPLQRPRQPSLPSLRFYNEHMHY